MHTIVLVIIIIIIIIAVEPDEIKNIRLKIMDDTEDHAKGLNGYKMDTTITEHQKTDQESTKSDNKLRELIAVKVLPTSLLKTTMVAFKVLPLGSYARMPAPSPPF
jgi:predicted Holliday junction resolvase-like endonuclease